MRDVPPYVSGRRGFLGHILNGSLAAAWSPEHASAFALFISDEQAEKAHVEALFNDYQEAWREVEAASGAMENPTAADEQRWKEVSQKESDALHALLSYQDKSLSAFRIRSDCIKSILQQDKLPRDLGEKGDAFEVFLKSVSRL